MCMCMKPSNSNAKLIQHSAHTIPWATTIPNGEKAAQALKPSNSNARLIQHSAHAAAGDKQMADLGGVSICVCVCVSVCE